MVRIYDILNSVSETLTNSAKEQLGLKKIKADNGENESPEMEMQEYKQDFYGMSVSSIKAIASHAQMILDNLENPQVKENLTESFLQGKIAITEDYMRTIHDYVMFSESDDDINSVDAGEKKKKKMPPFAPMLPTNEPAGPPSGPTAPAIPAAEEVDTRKKKKKISIKNLYKSIFIKNDDDNEDDYDTLDDTGPKLDYSFTADSGNKPGLWDNIRKKKEKMGKNYRPAKPGQKDRPDPEQWKKLTK